MTEYASTTPDSPVPLPTPSASDGLAVGGRNRREYGVALPASVAVHVVLVLILIFGLPLPQFQTPPQEQAVEVDLVPPPGEEEQKTEAEQPPPSPPPQQPEQQPEPPAEEQSAAQPPPPQVLQPVQRFGEEDAGPRLSQGNAAEEGEQAERTEPQQPQQRDAPVEQSARPEALKADRADQQATQGEAQEPLIEPPTVPVQEPEAETPPAEDAGALASRAETGVTIATTAMKDLPRGVRAGRLCVSELRERMLNSVPPYFPDLLPSFRLDQGTVLDAQRAAFRMGGEWYGLKYRCEIDDDATRVLSFAFEVGGRLSQAECQRRGIPAR